MPTTWRPTRRTGSSPPRTSSDLATDKNIEAFDVDHDYVSLWSSTSRANPRQLDADSTNGLLYVGYTGTAAGSGGFSVHDPKTGKVLGDFADPKFGKDGYGISVDEQTQRVFVSNRDFRLNPPGSELDAVAVTVSTAHPRGRLRRTTPSSSLDSVDKSNAPAAGRIGVLAGEEEALPG